MKQTKRQITNQAILLFDRIVVAARVNPEVNMGRFKSEYKAALNSLYHEGLKRSSQYELDAKREGVEAGKREGEERIVTEFYSKWSVLLKEAPGLEAVVRKFTELIVMKNAIYQVLKQSTKPEQKDFISGTRSLEETIETVTEI